MSSVKWFDDYFGSIYSYILLQVKDPHTAEDLTQETFLKVIANEHQFRWTVFRKNMDFSDCVYDNDELFQKEKSFNVLYRY